MFSNWIVFYQPEGVENCYYLQPYFHITPKGDFRLQYVELLNIDMEQVGRWYRENMPVNLTRDLEKRARRETVSNKPTGSGVAISPVARKIGR